MVFIKNNSIGKIWLEYLKHVLLNGTLMDDDRGKIIEVPTVTIELEKANKTDKILKNYADPKILRLYTRKMTSMEIIPELKSSYGKRLYSQLGVNQVDWLVKRLKNKPFTKAASISLLLPNDPGPRIPCLIAIDAKIRNNKLILTGMFRSQNALNSYGNMIGLLNLQEKISRKLKISKGLLRLFVLSPHLYICDLDRVLDITKLKKSNVTCLG